MCKDARRLQEGDFHEGLATSAGRRGTNSIGLQRAKGNTENNEVVASRAEFATISGADRLIGGGVVGFLLPPRA